VEVLCELEVPKMTRIGYPHRLYLLVYYSVCRRKMQVLCEFGAPEKRDPGYTHTSSTFWSTTLSAEEKCNSFASLKHLRNAVFATR
jgi:hypothetical protein